MELEPQIKTQECCYLGTRGRSREEYFGMVRSGHLLGGFELLSMNSSDLRPADTLSPAG